MTDLQFNTDELQLYFGEPFTIKTKSENAIQIFQPTIGDILKNGERNVYSVVNTFIANPTM